MDQVTSFMEAYGYLGVALVVALENLFPPIPSEIVLPFAGFMTVESQLTVWGMILASTLGSLLGALLLYGLGAWVGRERMYAFITRYGKYLRTYPKDLEAAERWFTRYGGWTIFFCRMIPLIRSLISIPAGLEKMPLFRFVLFTVAGTLIWNSLLISAGAALGVAWPTVSRWASTYDNVLLGILGILAIYGIYRWWTRPGAPS